MRKRERRQKRRRFIGRKVTKQRRDRRKSKKMG
jgi:hypothetical protein